jgi:hypothetical protein
MAKIGMSKTRRPRKRVGEVAVAQGNAAEFGGFGHFYAGSDLAVPTRLANGTQVYQTNSGRTFTKKKLSA